MQFSHEPTHEPSRFNRDAFVASVADIATSGIKWSQEKFPLDQLLYEELAELCKEMQKEDLPDEDFLKLAQRTIWVARSGFGYHPDRKDPSHKFFKAIIVKACRAIARTEGADFSVTFHRQVYTQPTPQLEVRCAHFIEGESPEEDQVLLVKESDTGLYNLPGGYEMPGYSGGGNSARELAEESRFVTNPKLMKLVIMQDQIQENGNYRHYRRMTFIAYGKLTEDPSLDLKETDEAAYVKMKDLESVDLDPLKSAITLIRRAHQHFRNPNMGLDQDHSYDEYLESLKDED